MARCIFDNLTHEQAVTLAKWFEGQGEQDCEFWFESKGVKPPTVNVRTSPEIDGEDVIVHCR